MRIVFSDHALKQLEERNISRDRVQEAIRKPHQVTRQSSIRRRAIRRFRRTRKLYLLVVIFDERDSTKEIVTAFITSKIGKYL